MSVACRSAMLVLSVLALSAAPSAAAPPDVEDK
jgi:hypothetical protein